MRTVAISVIGKSRGKIMRSKVLISLFIVFAMVAIAMMPLSIYDNGNVNAAGGGTDTDPFLVSSVEELVKVGSGSDDWGLDKHYKLTQNIEFDSSITEHNTNGGVNIALTITYSAGLFTVSLSPSSGTISTLNIWLGTEYESYGSSQGTITMPGTPGIYTMTIGGTHSGDRNTFAYAVKVNILSDMTGWNMVPIVFDSNGNFTPIGTEAEPFTGTFDGAGFEIRGMNVAVHGFDGSVAYAGLFGYVVGTADKKAEIKDLGITGGYVIGSSAISDAHAGSIAGWAVSSSITNCYNTGYVNAAAVSNNNVYARAGGIVGYTGSLLSITGCYNIGNVNAFASSSGTTHTSRAHAGGIAGHTYYTSITDCYNISDVNAFASSSGSGTAHARAGGIAGYEHYFSSITNCYNISDVSAFASNSGGGAAHARAGGIAGEEYSSSSITDCYNTGYMNAFASNTGSGTAYARAGGIAGYAQSSPTITDCYNTGDLTATANTGSGTAYTYAGGIIGYADTSTNITNCYNTGDVAATADGGQVMAYAGGIAGFIGDRLIVHSYFLVNGLELTGNAGYVKVEGDDSGSRSPDLMKKMETYTGWNFETDPITWSISSDLNDGFPVLEVFMFTLTLEFEGDGNVIGPVRIYGGSTATVIMVPDEGGKIISVTDNRNDVTALVSDNKYDITNIFGERTVKVVFESIAVPDIDPDVDGNSWGLIILIVIMTTIVCTAYFFALKDRDDDEEQE